MGADINLKNRNGKDALAVAQDQLQEVSQNTDPNTPVVKLAQKVLEFLRVTRCRQRLGKFEWARAAAMRERSRSRDQAGSSSSAAGGKGNNEAK